MSHLFHYKGYAIIFENSLYYLAIENTKKYLTLLAVFSRIDELIKITNP